MLSLFSLPDFRTTKAFTIVPRSSSGAPITPHSATAGCASSAPSTSGPAMLYPAETIMSSVRAWK
jgi:hypothetical protein